MMHGRNLMRTIAAEHAATDPKTRVGTITAYNPSTYAVKVMFQPSGVESGWIPIKTAWVGNDWGLQAGPTIGDLVTVAFQEGGHDAGVVLGSLYNNVEQPMAVPSGELWVKHSSGSFLKFLNDGDVQVFTARDLNVQTTRDANLNVGRDLIANVTRDVIVTAGGKFSATITGYAHITSSAEITLAGPVVSINAPIIGLNGNVTQTTGAGSAGVTMQGPVHVIDQIKSDTEVIAVTTPLHTHDHVAGVGHPTP